MEIKRFDFSICKTSDYSKVDLSQEYCFSGKSDEERSLVCISNAYLVMLLHVLSKNGYYVV